MRRRAAGAAAIRAVQRAGVWVASLVDARDAIRRTMAAYPRTRAGYPVRLEAWNRLMMARRWSADQPALSVQTRPSATLTTSR
jgi:hypothetical protein